MAKETFAGRMKVTTVLTESIYNSLLDYAKSKNVPVCEMANFEGWPFIGWAENNVVGWLSSETGATITKITIDDFIQYCDNYEPVSTENVTFNIAKSYIEKLHKDLEESYNFIKSLATQQR